MSGDADKKAGGAPGEASLHAAAVAVGEDGVLIRGSSGAGKSRLALALIEAAEAAGLFARLVGDDRVEVKRRGGRLIARGHPRIRGLIEQRGEGILEAPVLPAAVIRLAIDLAPAAEGPPRYPEPGAERALLLDVELERLHLRQDAAGSELTAAVLRRLAQRRRSSQRHVRHS